MSSPPRFEHSDGCAAISLMLGHQVINFLFYFWEPSREPWFFVRQGEVMVMEIPPQRFMGILSSNSRITKLLLTRKSFLRYEINRFWPPETYRNGLLNEWEPGGLKIRKSLAPSVSGVNLAKITDWWMVKSSQNAWVSQPGFHLPDGTPAGHELYCSEPSSIPMESEMWYLSWTDSVA